jgi:hypothetical protein
VARLLRSALFAALCLVVLSPAAPAQVTIDPDVVLSATVKPADYPGWPDSLGAQKVRSGFDINGNGKKEFLLLANPVYLQYDQRPWLFWFENSGDNQYTLLWSAQVPGNNDGSLELYADIAVADFDKDNLQEILVSVPRWRTNPNTDIVIFYEFDGSTFPDVPTFVTNLDLPDNFRYFVTRMMADDVDGDGELELITTSRRDDWGGSDVGRSLIVSHLEGGDISNSSFSYFAHEFVDSSRTLRGGAVYDLTTGDLDRDGKNEIWVFTWDLLSVAVYEATGANTYALQADINQARPDNDVGARNSMSFYDADGDGKKEWYVAGITDSENPGNIHCINAVDDVSTLTTASVVTLTPDLEPINEWSYEGAEPGDIDGDGKMEYLVAGAGIRRTVFRLQYVSGPAAVPASYTMGELYKDETVGKEYYSWMNLDIADDLDGDGKKEILIPNIYAYAADDPALIILESVTTSTAVGDPEPGVPMRTELLPNYPNPFNPSTTLAFEVATAGPVTVTILDMLGREVARPVDGVVAAGSHRVPFEARGLASGTYYVRFRAGNVVTARPIVLVR